MKKKSNKQVGIEYGKAINKSISHNLILKKLNKEIKKLEKEKKIIWIDPELIYK